MRMMKRSIRLATFCAVLLGGALGLTASAIDWPAAAPAKVVASDARGNIDWP